MLLLIATPIGNMGDISCRAKEALASCDLLLCEDTRHTGQFLHALGIDFCRLKSLHKFNEAQREEEVLLLLREGKKVGLVSDAGTPGIADPGARLVALCHQEGICVSIIPGACAFASAYALSGLEDCKVQFLGFAPKTSKERDSLFARMREYDGASVVYESPKRVCELISEAEKIDETWEILFVRELTKVHEEVVKKKVSELAKMLSGRDLKGECVLVFYPCVIEKPSLDELAEQVGTIRDSFCCSVKEAIEVVAKQYGVSQNELYRHLLALKTNDC